MSPACVYWLWMAALIAGAWRVVFREDWRLFLVAMAVFVGVMAVARPAGAQTIVSGFVSKHSTCCYEERNHGLGVRLDDGPLAGWGAGTYVNSFDQRSWYVAREWQWGEGRIRPGLLVGAVTGYPVRSVSPMVLPELVLHVGQLEVAVMGQPLKVGAHAAVVAAQIRWSFR